MDGAIGDGGISPSLFYLGEDADKIDFSTINFPPNAKRRILVERSYIITEYL